MPLPYVYKYKNKISLKADILEVGTKFNSHTQIAASKFNISEHLVFDQNCMKFWRFITPAHHLKVKYSKFKLSDDAGAKNEIMS